MKGGPDEILGQETEEVAQMIAHKNRLVKPGLSAAMYASTLPPCGQAKLVFRVYASLLIR